MKKFSCLLLALTILLSGCSDKASSGSTAKVSSVTSSEESDTGIDVDKHPLTVEVTLPAGLVGQDVTQESLEEKTDGIISSTLNDDGSITCVMTYSKHDELLQAAADSVNQSLSELVTSGDYSTITDADADADFKTFTLTTTASDKDELGLDYFAALVCLMTGAHYNALDAKEYDDLVVNFVTQDGTLIDTYSMQDLMSSDAWSSADTTSETAD